LLLTFLALLLNTFTFLALLLNTLPFLFQFGPLPLNLLTLTVEIRLLSLKVFALPDLFAFSTPIGTCHPITHFPKEPTFLARFLRLGRRCCRCLLTTTTTKQTFHPIK
jgi:hypothetical protein